MSKCTGIKVCVVGEAGVGKTSISIRYVEDTFDPNVESTLGASFLSRYCTAPNGARFQFQIWDTAGSEKFKSLVPLYYRGASVIIFVYDINHRSSLCYGITEWVKEVKEKALSDVLFVLVGNKFDTADLYREVQEWEGKEFAESIKAQFFETSAKTGHNVLQIFQHIAVELEKKQTFIQGEKSGSIALTDRSGKSPSICSCSS